MITALGHLAQVNGSKIFFYNQSDKETQSFSYAQTRMLSAALAQELAKRGVSQGSHVACSLYNGPEFVFLALAAAYGGFTLATLNPRLSEEEQRLRKVELESAVHEHDIMVLTDKAIRRMIVDALGFSMYDVAKNGTVPTTPHALAAFTYARQHEEKFKPKKCGIVMFTSGTSGTPKATMLTWEALMGSADAATTALMRPRRGVWQLILPMCHVGGLQVMVRSLLNESQFILYERYVPSRILNDVMTFKATHISVVDKMLVDLLENDHDRIISQYECIMLGGAALNNKTLRKALRAKARVYASYGMTETCSALALAPINRSFDGGLQLLPGYEVRIMRPNQKGIGQVHVKGPGVFKGYLNARGSFSADGWFVTGDRGYMDRDGFLHVLERVDDVIISGGENIYPEEVRGAILRIPGVKDACVFGTADETWGYRPVAFVEADYSAETIKRDHEQLGLDPQETGVRAATCPQEFAHMIHDFLEPRMSHLQHPKHILVLPEFPRTTAGKTDVVALKKLYDRRIDIKSIELLRVKQPMAEVGTAKARVKDRESFFVRVTDWAGRTGIGECVSFATNWYLPETIAEDYEVVRTRIASVVTNERYLHPREVSRSLATFPYLAKYPMAKASVEPAIWDLYGKIVSQPLSQLIGGDPAKKQVPGGVVIGIMSDDDTVAAVDAAVAAGYKRVKIKISPDSAFEKVQAVREKHPDLIIMLDANQSFSEEYLDVLHRFDALNIACIEEPLDPNYVPSSGITNIFERLSLLQETIATPVCLDESVVTAQDMTAAMAFSNLRCYTVKISKFGGIQPALDFCQWASEYNIDVWMGGMFDTGVSKRMHAAFETLPTVTMIGDISDYTFYFNQDSCVPATVLDQGMLTLNQSGYEAGLGCKLNDDYLKSILIDQAFITG